MAKTTELEAAYRATAYRVFLPGGLCELRLDQASENLRHWLEMAGASEFAILTAHNPGAKQLDQESNMARQSQMEIELLEAGYEPYAGENEADTGDWPAEETCFIADMELAEAKVIAANYAQNAIVHGLADGVPRLVWIEE
jgi:hypothetical protein